MDIEKLKEHLKEKYGFIRLLGRGGFAEVHLAMDKMLERKVAIKILLPQHSSDPDIVKRFIREARLYAKMEHPNLISIYETGIAEGTAFIVMKYVKGDNLKTFIGKDPKSRLELAPMVARSMASALNYIHSKGIIHRDVKPANIILEEGRTNIYLADFGIARSDSSQTMTQTGSIMGTPYYISPEQIKGGVIDHRSDIYALGATLFELVAGKPVFSADSSVEILYKHVNDEPEPVWKSTPATPKILRYVISRCLEKKPENRFQKASDLRAALAGKQTASVTRYLSSIESGRSVKGKKAAFLAASLILIPLITFIVYKGKTGKPPEPVNIEKKESGTASIPVQKPEMNPGDRGEVELPAAGKADGEESAAEPERKTEENAGSRREREPVKKDSQAESKPPVRRERKIEEQKPLSSEPGVIRFSSYPPSEIYWNGLKLGHTSQVFRKNFPPGKYKIIFKIPGYISEEKQISVEPGKEVAAHYRFSPYGFLTVTARPYARFYINGTDSGVDPIFEKKFPVGTYTVRAVKKGYKTEERVIQIKNMKKKHISFTLTKEE